MNLNAMQSGSHKGKYIPSDLWITKIKRAISTWRIWERHMYPFSDHLLITCLVLHIWVKRQIRTNTCISSLHSTNEMILKHFCFIDSFIKLMKLRTLLPETWALNFAFKFKEFKNPIEVHSYTPWVLGLHIKKFLI